MIDIFDLLLEKYATSCAEKHSKLVVIEEFIAGCRKMLADNPPVSTCPVNNGIGIRLADGTEITINAGDSSKLYNESLPVTGSTTRGDVVPSPSLVIFGGEK